MKPLTLANLRLTEAEYWDAWFPPKNSPVMSPERVCDAQIAKALGVLRDRAKRAENDARETFDLNIASVRLGAFTEAMYVLGLTWPPVSEPERPTVTIKTGDAEKKCPIFQALYPVTIPPRAAKTGPKRLAGGRSGVRGRSGGERAAKRNGD